VEEVPDSFPLTIIQDRQRRAVTEGELQVEGDLAGALAPFRGRVAYLDFETVGPAIPVWEGFGPWQPHPVQFSCHIASPEGALEHVEWLADGPGDGRASMARVLVDALAGVDAVVAYNMPFEKKCLESLAAADPEYAPEIQAIVSKLRDLLPVVRDHVYHPDFLGASVSSPCSLPWSPVSTMRPWRSPRDRRPARSCTVSSFWGSPERRPGGRLYARAS